jgi:quercetin dioxygenase-like cupin family protein
MHTIHQTPDSLSWRPHPSIPGGRVAILLHGQEGVAPVGALVELPSGISAEPHRHTQADDLLYILRGHGKLWVESHGEFLLREGCFLKIPAGVWHCPREITQTLLIYNLWLPIDTPTNSRKDETL